MAQNTCAREARHRPGAPICSPKRSSCRCLQKKIIPPRAGAWLLGLEFAVAAFASGRPPGITASTAPDCLDASGRGGGDINTAVDFTITQLI